MEVYRTPDERFAGLPAFPFTPRYLEQDGLRMHYLDEGDGAPILLLHGEPTWSFLYRRHVPALAPTARVIVPDYFGFGRSDKPLDAGWYSYDAHVASIARLVEELDLRRVTIVVHDWGGPIGLRVAVEHPERVERLVITNTLVGAGRAPSETWLQFRDVLRRVGGGLDVGRLVAAGCATELPDDVRAAYDAPFPTPESKAGVLAFPELVPTERDHPSAAALLALRDALKEWTRPTLVLWGAEDPVLPAAYAERFADLVPGALPAELIAGAGHFVHEDRGEEVAARIARFAAG
ncbi:MAG TPA: haloalkane dehalogenase [Gaiellaceae bacterium]|jgi:haloalkane dehalogenase